ncbi:UNKNOWN [Stylonychia lemnae]|uniref:Uncharacterized protein n=1 Tax=Stylonychia lemnae TaxID=5949 RepID=A0A078ATW1_STYLE|nr:UNKNOWN [Stylonychia lemnae]|eukprot:CDW85694.1 UNKNOWN [Stylonychia lemnae]
MIQSQKISLANKNNTNNETSKNSNLRSKFNPNVKIDKTPISQHKQKNIIISPLRIDTNPVQQQSKEQERVIPKIFNDRYNRKYLLPRAQKPLDESSTSLQTSQVRISDQSRFDNISYKNSSQKDNDVGKYSSIQQSLEMLNKPKQMIKEFSKLSLKSKKNTRFESEMNQSIIFSQKIMPQKNDLKYKGDNLWMYKIKPFKVITPRLSSENLRYQGIMRMAEQLLIHNDQIQKLQPTILQRIQKIDKQERNQYHSRHITQNTSIKSIFDSRKFSNLSQSVNILKINSLQKITKIYQLDSNLSKTNANAGVGNHKKLEPINKYRTTIRQNAGVNGNDKPYISEVHSKVQSTSILNQTPHRYLKENGDSSIFMEEQNGNNRSEISNLQTVVSHLSNNSQKRQLNLVRYNQWNGGETTNRQQFEQYFNQKKQIRYLIEQSITSVNKQFEQQQQQHPDFKQKRKFNADLDLKSKRRLKQQ